MKENVRFKYPGHKVKVFRPFFDVQIADDKYEFPWGGS